MPTKVYRRTKRNRYRAMLAQTRAALHREREDHQLLRGSVTGAADNMFRYALRDAMEEAARHWTDKVALEVMDKVGKLARVKRFRGPMSELQTLVFEIELMSTAIHLRSFR